MNLKTELFQFVKDELQIPLCAIALPEDYYQEDLERISSVQEIIAKTTPIAEGTDAVLQPKDYLSEAKSVIVTGVPSRRGKKAGFEECRKELLGRATGKLHGKMRFIQSNAEKSYKICDFFTSRGFQCFSLSAGQFPIKLIASKCGVGYYGKNSMLQNPDFGSRISLYAFITDAELEPDDPLNGDCGTCELCINACPTGAISTPYICDVTKCIDFHLVHNKKNIPIEIREKTANLLGGEGCPVCSDVCPKNRKLKPTDELETPEYSLYPLLEILDLTDDEWENDFAMTLMGFFLTDKKYLKRNAVIALGNFKDERALRPLARLLDGGEDELRGYAAWAIGNIGGGTALKHLSHALIKEKKEGIRKEIQLALAAAR